MSSLPVRVLVRGSSIATQVEHWGQSREDMAYPRVIERTLLDEGFAVDVRNRATIAERVSSAVRDWEPEISTWSPDVVVLHYGYAEAIHLFLPRFLERHANSLQWRPTALNRTYRRLVLRPVWKALAIAQMHLDRRVPAGVGRRQRRVARDLAMLISRVRRVLPGGLVLVPELTAPDGQWTIWFPGMTDRIERMNDAIRQVVEQSSSDDVRWVPTVDLADAVRDGRTETSTDGGHLPAEVHRLIGERIGHEIAGWARTQGHLKP